MAYTARDLNPLVRGDDWTIKLTITSGGSAVDITGYSYYFTLKNNIDDLDAAAALQVTATPGSPDAASGILYIRADSTDTDTLEANKTYYYDVQQTDGAGNIQTLLIGKVKVVKDVTRTTS